MLIVWDVTSNAFIHDYKPMAESSFRPVATGMCIYTRPMLIEAAAAAAAAAVLVVVVIVVVVVVVVVIIVVVVVAVVMNKLSFKAK
jgi:hypothetical protein